jgi:nucleolar complex protein 2
MTDFGAKSVSKFSVKPLDMSCCIKADATESGYGKAVSENVFELVLATCKAIATELSFPEIVTPTLMQLRSFVRKRCKNPEVARKFKTLIEKVY